MAAVTFDGVVKQYGDAPATVRGLDFTIDDGEFFTLLGPSGCGKSTTLRMVAGFISPTEGRIRLGDRDITHLPPNRRDMGMVFQSYALFPHLDVAANVAYGLRIRKVAGVERSERVREALRAVGLSDYAGRRIDQLSGGQQQRVALARALVIRPTVLLLDEPLSNLDAKLREETRAEIRSMQRAARTTAIYVTHDQSEAMAMSDRIAVLEAGRVHQVASPREVYHRPATQFVARFIGRSNVLPATVVETRDDRIGVRLVDGSSLVAPRPGGDVATRLRAGDATTVSLRTEGICLELAGERDRGTSVPGQMTGTVTSVEFTGASTVYAVDWADEHLVVTSPDAGDQIRAGDRVRLVASPDHVWVVGE